MKLFFILASLCFSSLSFANPCTLKVKSRQLNCEIKYHYAQVTKVQQSQSNPFDDANYDEPSMPGDQCISSVDLTDNIMGLEFNAYMNDGYLYLRLVKNGETTQPEFSSELVEGHPVHLTMNLNGRPKKDKTGAEFYSADFTCQLK